MKKRKVCAIFQFFVSFVFILEQIGQSYGARILNLVVPETFDLQDRSVTLDCQYEIDNEGLYAVKWYKDGDDHEFFRYAPTGGGTLTFPIPGVTVSNGSACDTRHCPITLLNVTKATGGSFRCEISSEAPAFRLGHQTKNMTIVANPRGVVTITTPKQEYLEGEEIWINCTAPPADPPPYLRWYVNGVILNPNAIINQSDSIPDEKGLITRSLAAQLPALKPLFLKSGILTLKCEVSANLQAPLYATVHMALVRSKEEKFDWLSSTGTLVTSTIISVFCCILLSFHV